MAERQLYAYQFVNMSGSLDLKCAKLEGSGTT
jgi:hypothetical protein